MQNICKYTENSFVIFHIMLMLHVRITFFHNHILYLLSIYLLIEADFQYSFIASFFNRTITYMFHEILTYARTLKYLISTFNNPLVSANSWYSREKVNVFSHFYIRTTIGLNHKSKSDWIRFVMLYYFGRWTLGDCSSPTVEIAIYSAERPMSILLSLSATNVDGRLWTKGKCTERIHRAFSIF